MPRRVGPRSGMSGWAQNCQRSQCSQCSQRSRLAAPRLESVRTAPRARCSPPRQGGLSISDCRFEISDWGRARGSPPRPGSSCRARAWRGSGLGGRRTCHYGAAAAIQQQVAGAGESGPVQARPPPGGLLGRGIARMGGSVQYGVLAEVRWSVQGKSMRPTGEFPP